jgi:hypothetical protein
MVWKIKEACGKAEMKITQVCNGKSVSAMAVRMSMTIRAEV